jgi:hypothetical protein
MISAAVENHEILLLCNQNETIFIYKSMKLSTMAASSNMPNLMAVTTL